MSAETVNAAISDETVPSMPPPGSLTVKLLRGIRQAGDDGTVVWHDTASVRELNGEDEEALAAVERKPGVLYTEYMNALLSRAVESVGDLPGDEAVLNKLILADREMLFLGILKATYGTEREMYTNCRACGAVNTVTIDLEEDFPVSIPDDLDPKVPFEVKGIKGKTFKVRLPNGDDTLFSQKHGATDPEVNTAMLSRCVEHGIEDQEEALTWAKNLSVGDRRKLVTALVDLKLGPTLEGVDTQCAECGAEMPILLDWVSLLLS